MMGQRRASTCRLDMLPAPGETWCWVAVVESERSVAGDVLERNGHMERDWRKIDSMTARAQRRSADPENWGREECVCE